MKTLPGELAVCDRLHPIALVFEGLFQNPAQGLFVFRYENFSLVHSPLLSTIRTFILICYKQRDLEGCPVAFTALDADQAAVFFDNPIRDRQPKSGPVVLGSEERGEDMREISLLDAAAGVGDVYPDKSSRPFPLLPDMKVRFYTGRDREASLPIHSLQAVFDQIKKDLGELRPIPLNRRQAGVKVFLDYDFALPKDLSLEEEEGVEEFVDVERNQI